MSNLVASPCCLPQWPAEPLLQAYGRMGFTAYEVFTEWAAARFDWTRAPEEYHKLGRQFGLSFTSLHLPVITEDSEAALERAVKAAQFAQELGVEIVLFKAASRELYVEMGKAFLDSIEKQSITAVLQNHAGSPLSTLDDFKFVLDGLGDARMKTLLEVGHFHSVGTSWQDALDYLGGTIALVHIKDQIGAESVPYGMGEIDLPALFGELQNRGYLGRYVVEMEVRDAENTLRYLEEALDYLEATCPGAKR